MTVQEIDGSSPSPPHGIIHIPGTGDPGNRRTCQPLVPFQETAQIIAVSAVPLRPTVPGWKASHLVEPAGVPRLGNQLHIPQDGVEGHGLEQGGLVHGGPVLVAPQNGGQIKPEAGHPVFGYPITQAVDNETARHRMVAIYNNARQESIYSKYYCQYL